MFKGIQHWNLIVMFCLLGAIFAFEMIGVFSPKAVTLTAIIKGFIPIPCRVMVLAWLIWHFFISDVVRFLGEGRTLPR